MTTLLEKMIEERFGGDNSLDEAQNTYRVEGEGSVATVTAASEIAALRKGLRKLKKAPFVIKDEERKYGTKKSKWKVTMVSEGIDESE